MLRRVHGDDIDYPNITTSLHAIVVLRWTRGEREEAVEELVDCLARYHGVCGVDCDNRKATQALRTLAAWQCKLRILLSAIDEQ